MDFMSALKEAAANPEQLCLKYPPHVHRLIIETLADDHHVLYLEDYPGSRGECFAMSVEQYLSSDWEVVSR